MASPIVVPFNFDPVITAVRTASYTIPSGRYAQVFGECDSGGSISVNGVTAVTTTAFSNIQVNGNAPSYTVPSGFRAKFRTISEGTTSGVLTLNGNSNYGNQDNTTVQGGALSEVGPGGTASVSSSGTGTFQGIHGVAIPSNATNRQAQFWLKAGDVLSGAGSWRAVVQEFNKIS